MMMMVLVPVLVVILQIALNILSSPFPLSLFCVFKKFFYQLLHGLGLYLVSSYFNRLMSFDEPVLLYY